MHKEGIKPIYIPANFFALGISILFGLFVWFIPRPSTVSLEAWQLFSIFVALIVGIIGKALSMGGMAFLALTVLTVTKTLTIKESLSGFSNPVVWLVIAAFLLARSFIKTGLGKRVAYHFIGLIGKKTLGLGYGLVITELFLAPAIPSNTARAGGILYPVVKALAIGFGSTPERHSQRLIGSFLVLTCYYANLITSAMFLTAMAANPIIAAMSAEVGIKLSWGTWALAALVPGLVSLLIIPYLVYKLYPPDIKETPQAKQMAQDHLREMGKMSIQEWITLGVFLLLAFLWIMGESLAGLDSTVVALIGISILLVTGVLTWNDIKQEHEAWDTLMWFSVLVMIAGYLNQFGIIQAFTKGIQYYLEGLHWTYAFPLLVCAYFYSHYAFASNTAHITSMFPSFLSIGIALGTPPYLMALSLGYSSNLFACLTHYGTGCAPILFGSEYVSLKIWWQLGAIVSVVFLFIWIGLGSMWWHFLGLLSL